MARSAAVGMSNTVTNLTQFVAWGKVIGNLLRATMTQTTDTGQVNWTTISALPATQATGVYEVFVFGDTFQAASPIYVRVDYVYWAAVSGAHPQFRVGSGTDGAGNLTGVTPVLNTQQGGYVGTQTVIASNADGSQLVFGIGLTSGTGTALDSFGALVVERFRNADGTPNGEGYNAWVWNSTAANVAGWAYQVSRTYATTTGLITDFNTPIWIPFTTGPVTTFSGSQASAFPFFTWGERQVRGPSQAVLYGFQGDWPRNSEVSITHSGAPKKFWSLGGAALVTVPAQSTISAAVMRTGYTPLFRYE